MFVDDQEPSYFNYKSLIKSVFIVKRKLSFAKSILVDGFAIWQTNTFYSRVRFGEYIFWRYNLEDLLFCSPLLTIIETLLSWVLVEDDETDVESTNKYRRI